MKRACLSLTSVVLIGLMGGLLLPAPSFGAIDLSDWVQVHYNLPGGQGSGNWVLSDSNTTVTQIINCDPTMFLSDTNMSDYIVDGSFEVETSGDDDFIGFIFGWEDTTHFYVLDWKQSRQSSYGLAAEGFSVKKISAPSYSDLTHTDFWDSAGTANSTVLASHWGSGRGWDEFVEYDFHLYFHEGDFDINVSLGDSLLWETSVVDGSYPSGQFGFYNFSQGDVRYSAFEEINIAPMAFIDSILPNPSQVGEEVFFFGHGEDPDGAVVAHQWRSSIDGALSTSPTFSTTALTEGIHMIYYRVQDDQEEWSEEDSTEIEVQPTAVSESDRGSDLFFVSASRPNPFRSSVSISYTLPVDDRVRVEVFDVSGQIVRTLADGTVASGTHTATWDGTDSSGRPVTNGIYFFKLTASSKMEMRRVILLR
jgi:hypothetical protein